MDNFPDDIKVHEEFYEQIYETLEKEPFAQHLGIKLTALGEGTASAEVDIANHMLNAHGTVHGGIIFTLGDYVFAAACNSYGRTAVGLSTTVNFMAPAVKGTILKATATEEKRNHRTSWYKIRVESGQELVATVEALAYRKNHYFVPIDEMKENKS